MSCSHRRQILRFSGTRSSADSEGASGRVLVTGRISSPVSYVDSQALGGEMRASGVQACLYVSARARGRHLNLAVFANVFRPLRPLDEERWACTASPDRVEFRAQRLVGRDEDHAYEREQFLVQGKLPAPAV